MSSLFFFFCTFHDRFTWQWRKGPSLLWSIPHCPPQSAPIRAPKRLCLKERNMWLLHEMKEHQQECSLDFCHEARWMQKLTFSEMCSLRPGVLVEGAAVSFRPSAWGGGECAAPPGDSPRRNSDKTFLKCIYFLKIN